MIEELIVPGRFDSLQVGWGVGRSEGPNGTSVPPRLNKVIMKIRQCGVDAVMGIQVLYSTEKEIVN